MGALSATAGEKYKKQFLPLLWHFVQVPFNDAHAIEQNIDKETAAVILEPIQGEAGVIIPDDEYLFEVKQICRDNNALLILDEIQTGTGRTGKFLASHWDDVLPDIVCLGKGLAGGLPIGTTIVTDKVASSIPRVLHTTTFGGNPLTMAAVKAVLRLLDEDMLAHIAEIGGYFIEGLQAIASDQIPDIRGKGLMVGIELRGPHTPVLKALQQRKILAIPATSNVVRFLPPYIIEKAHCDLVVETLTDIFKKSKL